MSSVPSVCVTVSEQLAEAFYGPRGKSHLPSFLQGGCVLVGLEFGVIVRELVEEDGNGQTVQDDPERDADEREDTTQHGLRVDVPIAHRGDAHLEGGEKKCVTLDLHVTGD